MKTRLIRNGVEQPPIANDENYDFNFQAANVLQKEITIKSVSVWVTEITRNYNHYFTTKLIYTTTREALFTWLLSFLDQLLLFMISIGATSVRVALILYSFFKRKFYTIYIKFKQKTPHKYRHFHSIFLFTFSMLMTLIALQIVTKCSQKTVSPACKCFVFEYTLYRTCVTSKEVTVVTT